MRLEPAEIPTVPLDGLLYWPEGEAQGGVLYFHDSGNYPDLLVQIAHIRCPVLLVRQVP